MLVTKPRRPRQSVVGTTGCLTCRIRKVKCDEAKPHCQRCRATGRACDGYSVLPFSRPELLQGSKRQGHHDHRGSRLAATGGGGSSLACVMLTDGAFQDKLEQRYFQFFRCCTVTCTNLTVDSPFWDRVILQAFHAEPAVKHAILALAAMHGCMLDHSDKHASRLHMLYAKEQYTVALGEARQLVETAAPNQIHRILMVCLLFVAWEGVQGDYQASQRHMNSGRALFARFSRQIQARPSLTNIVHDITQVLARMDISAMSFSDDSAPYRASPHELLDTGLQLVTQPFTSVQQASASLMEMTRRLLRLGNELILETDAAGLIQQQNLVEECAQHLRAWNGYWESWCAEKKAGSSDSPSMLNVQLWRACANAFVLTGFGGPETRYDGAMTEFRSVVEFSEKLSAALCPESEAISFSLDLGYLIPTFFVSTRCRDPCIRRRALKILQSYPRHEGAWQSGPAAAIADKWMQIEERGLSQVNMARQIPEYQRVVTMEIQVQKSDGRARLQFQLAGVGGIGSVIEEIVTW